MSRKPDTPLRKGWTTGACATAAVKAALHLLWGQERLTHVRITLPKGERPEFAIAHLAEGPGWAEAGVVKDAGDDPDVTHGAMIIARVAAGDGTDPVQFRAGAGVGMVTKPGLPIPVGEPAINPVPRQMMRAVVADVAERLRIQAQDRAITITISVPGGEELAAKTWNPRLGIKGGLSILGTTGIVRPFSCAAWIASIHRGVDVARAEGLTHVAGCTGASSERAVQADLGLPDHAMLDMGDFAGGMLKYIARHPVDRVTIGGGLAKLVKLGQGAIDLHSGRSQVDFDALARAMDTPSVAKANTVLQVYEELGEKLVHWVVEAAQAKAQSMVPDTVRVDVIAVDRSGRIVGRSLPQNPEKNAGAGA
jgi:cobalt-precorrin-5B (C1)-methyltransferase